MASGNRPPSQPGNPSGRGLSQEDPPTRERLLTAARRVFGERGFEGGSVREITREAEANLGAVTYHFGSKEALYHEVIRSVLTPLRERTLAVTSGPGSPAERIDAFIRGFFEHLRENPDQPRFLLQQLVKGPSIPPVLLEVMLPVVRALLGVVEEGQRDGSIRPGPPLYFVLSLLAQPVYFMLVTHKAPPQLLPSAPGDPALTAAMADHAVQFALGGISPGEVPRRGNPHAPQEQAHPEVDP